MKIIYLTHADLRKSKGHHRATYQKLRSLKGLVNKLIIVSSTFKKFKFLELVFLELKCILLIFKHNPDAIISRGYVGYLAQKFAKFKKIKTVREVHADIIEEIKQYDKSFISRKLLLPFGYYMQIIDKQSDVRIFNHPKLLFWFRNKFKNINNTRDIYAYNGFDYSENCQLDKSKAKNKFKLKTDIQYLVFTGGANYWHGVNYLAELQKEFNSMDANIQIICGGGKISSKDDPDRCLINFEPLNSKGCMNLIKASDACILPVRQSRVSPGSALKLYDYFLHKKFIITQKNLEGYSDEVLRYGFGTLVNFEESNLTALKIIKVMKKLKKNNKTKINIKEFSWETRMSKWINCLEFLRNKQY